jgi:hypothetical protein
MEKNESEGGEMQLSLIIKKRFRCDFASLSWNQDFEFRPCAPSESCHFISFHMSEN